MPIARAAFNPRRPASGVGKSQLGSASMASRCAVCTAIPQALSAGEVAIRNKLADHLPFHHRPFQRLVSTHAPTHQQPDLPDTQMLPQQNMRLYHVPDRHHGELLDNKARPSADRCSADPNSHNKSPGYWRKQ